MIEKKVELWKDIPGYEGYYQASNFGRVRSLDRTILTTNGQERFYKGKVLNPTMSKGYKKVNLTMEGREKTFKISQLVAMAFLGHEPDGLKLVIDHINGNKLDDRVENLRIVTQRANTSTCFRINNGTFRSEYVGVHWDINSLKWISRIYYDGIRIHLGSFDNEADASDAYQKALSRIKNGSFNPNDYKPKYSSRYKGVNLDKRVNKWMARITIKGSLKYLGYFNNEIDASNAYQEALSKIKNGSFNPNDYTPKYSSKYKGVNFHNRDKNWQVQMTISGKRKYLGSFKTEEEAYEAQQKARKEYNL